MANKDLISVLVPFYNAASYLRKCIESVLSQTYQNFELILVDDGSSDESLAMCHEYAAIDSRIKVCSLAGNKGPGSARQIGIERATGKYLTFIDSDDVFTEDALEVLYGAMGENTDLVVAQHKRVSQDYVDIKQVKFKTGTFNLRGNYFAEYLCRDYFEYVHGVELWNKLYRMAIAKKCWTAPVDLAFGSDAYMLLEYLLFCNEIVCIDMLTYIYTYRDHSVARSSSRKMLLVEFARTALDMKDQIYKNKIIRRAYPYIVYKFLSIALTRYKKDTPEAVEKLIMDIEELHGSSELVSVSKNFLFSPGAISCRSRFLPEIYVRIQAVCLYLAIFTGDAWYYTRLYPGLIVKNGRFITFLKVVANKIILRVRK